MARLKAIPFVTRAVHRTAIDGDSDLEYSPPKRYPSLKRRKCWAHIKEFAARILPEHRKAEDNPFYSSASLPEPEKDTISNLDIENSPGSSTELRGETPSIRNPALPSASAEPVTPSNPIMSSGSSGEPQEMSMSGAIPPAVSPFNEVLNPGIIIPDSISALATHVASSSKTPAPTAFHTTKLTEIEQTGTAGTGNAILNSSSSEFAPRQLDHISTADDAILHPKAKAVSMPIGHFASDRVSLPTPMPKNVYFSPDPGSKVEARITKHMSALSRKCASCGLQLWQCANASNFSGTDFKKLPKIVIEPEPIDQERLQHYINLAAYDTNRNYAILNLIERNGSFENSVAVRAVVGRKTNGRGDAATVQLCEAKRAEIKNKFPGQIVAVKAGSIARAYLVDQTGEFMVGVWLLQTWP